ncbi:UNVERIFIED_CONTAM: hypothetical protein PYX00_006669 [Menopon gallinae]|uniref:Glucosidase II subunit alpha n=1 Tax=Menopon gallinae TaxID=328185 RepID=A0AAW2HWM7_9NEOP
MKSKLILIALSTIICLSNGVDKTNFKSCSQSSFCKRCRSMEPNKSNFKLLIEKTEIAPSSLRSQLVDTNYNVYYSFYLYAVENGIFRFKINELNPEKIRFEVPFVLDKNLTLAKLTIVDSTSDKIIVKAGDNTVHIFASPFKVNFYAKNELVVSANDRGLLRFEFHRNKPNSHAEENTEGENVEKTEKVEDIDQEFSLESGAWEENFKSAHDTKPNGPEAVALDFTFPEAVAAYGLPEHADSFTLKSTKNSDPYRLYNLDVFEYELDSKMALYAAIPLLFAHGTKNTVGVFWLNAAETWIDYMSNGDQNVLSSIVNLVSGSNNKPVVDAHFMSESGIIDAFILMGPSPDTVQHQYATLTGTTPLPQMFSLAYHQCRWNYNDQDDVQNVAQGFDDHDIPMDVMWLDIEHTDGKKYFTWDPVRFPNPLEMTKNLTEKGRKLVVIVDPHIKRDPGYFLHNDAEANNYYVKSKDGKDYEGWCWPGSSSYLDFLNPAVREYYANRYLLENYPGSTLDTYIWNDMNEPSVFNGPEITMPKDIIHYGDWEHRHIHNIYGFLHTMTTHDGLLRRSEGKLRPFILTRSAFAGSQRFAAIWTGDNAAEWGHLKATIPMCLSLSLCGMTLCGADVGGFFKYPESELFARWFQAGAFQPFFRSHSHIDTKRREPWSMGQATTEIIREAIRKRYSYLPFWYTLMYEQEISASLVMRPLWTEFRGEEATFTIEDEYLLGRGLLVHPVMEQGVTSVSVYFPGTNEVWYDADTYEKFTTNGNVKISVDIKKIPVYIRGGFIIPKKERVRRASSLMRDDPYTLIVALDQNGNAKGTLYIDDEQSYDYRNGKYLYLELEFKDKTLTSKFIEKKNKYKTRAWVERVIIVGVRSAPNAAEMTTSDKKRTKLQTAFTPNNEVVVIRKPGVNIGEEWSIKLV